MERAKFKQFKNLSQENPTEKNYIDQPEWMGAIRPYSILMMWF